MDMINFDGLLIGIVTFLIIGLFHPVVVKAEYYWGTKCWCAHGVQQNTEQERHPCRKTGRDGVSHVK